MISATNTNKNKSFFIVSFCFAYKVKGVRFKVKGLRSAPPKARFLHLAPQKWFAKLTINQSG